MVIIKWTDRAVRHLESVYEYIAKDSAVYAKRYVRSLVASVKKLKTMPECGRKVPEFEDTAFREIFYRNHRIVYRFNNADKHIDILAVVHGAQDMQNVFYVE